MPNSSRILRAISVEDTPYEVTPKTKAFAGRHYAPDEAREEAQRILAGARLASEQITRTAMSEAAAQRAQIERIVEEAREKGHLEGLEIGKEEAIQAVNRELEELVRRITDLVGSLHEERVRNLREQEPEIVSLAVDIAERIIQEQVRIDPEMVTRIALAAVERTTEREEVTLRVHPNDLAVLEDFVPELKNRFKSLRKVHVQEDARVSPGSCMVETGNGYVDGTIESQTAEMRRELGLEE